MTRASEQGLEKSAAGLLMACLLLVGDGLDMAPVPDVQLLQDVPSTSGLAMMAVAAHSAAVLWPCQRLQQSLTLSVA